MFLKKRPIIGWEIVSRFLQIIEAIAIVVASFIIFQVPGQIKEWNLSQSNRSTDLLLRLEDRLRDGNNKKIVSAIENSRPILLKNNGLTTTQDLDYYLNDLMSISDMYSKGLIDCESAYSWFSNYFEKTLKNKEVSDYIYESQLIDSNNLGGLEEFYKTINSCD